MSIDPNKLYKLRQRRKDGVDCMSAAEFMEAVLVEEPAARPKDLLCPSGEWYCENDECDVREVCISMKHLDGLPDKPMKLKCPCCRKALKFHHFLRTHTLVPIGRSGAETGQSSA